jgi:hypothetical protein
VIKKLSIYETIKEGKFQTVHIIGPKSVEITNHFLPAGGGLLVGVSQASEIRIPLSLLIIVSIQEMRANNGHPTMETRTGAMPAVGEDSIVP